MSADSLLRTALAADVDHLSIPALSVAVETNPVIGELLSQVIGSLPVSRETLMRVAAASPYPSFALAAPAAVVLQRLADDPADEGEHAVWLLALSTRLADLGRREEALAAVDEAVTIRRQLAEARPATFLPHLKAALQDLADLLSMLNRPKCRGIGDQFRSGCNRWYVTPGSRGSAGEKAKQLSDR